MNKTSFDLISRSAVRATPAMQRRINLLLDSQVQTIADSVRHGGDGIAQIHTLEQTWAHVLAHLKEPWGVAFAVDGYNLSGTILKKKSFIMGEAKRTRLPSLELEGADSLVANFLKPRVSEWILKTSKIETATTARKYQDALQLALMGVDGAGATVGEIADSFAEFGLAINEARADLMAAVITNWTYNEGASTLYEHEGITQEEWLVTEDDKLCEFCAEMDGKVTAIRENYFGAGEQLAGADGGVLGFSFDIEHPPLHPNCLCCLVPAV